MTNRFLINGPETIIFARRKNGEEVPVLIDTSDLLKVALATKGTWCVGRVTNMKTPYCFTTCGGRTLYMHRVIMDTPEGQVVDHLNTNGLDNRKHNLENTTARENTRRGYERRFKAAREEKLIHIKALIDRMQEIIAA